MSADEIGTYIACGDIAGQVVGNELQIELRELNGSGYQGQATLTDNGDGTMTVTVVLTRIGDHGHTGGIARLLTASPGDALARYGGNAGEHLSPSQE